LNKYIKTLIAAVAILASTSAFAVKNHHVHAVVAHNPSIGSVAKEVQNNPFTFTFEILSLNPKFTFQGIRPAYEFELLYNLTKNFYVQTSFSTLRNNKYGGSILGGVQKSTGPVRPYAEIAYSRTWLPHLTDSGDFGYDVGVNIVILNWVIPSLEMDNFFNDHQRTMQGQLTFPMFKQFSLGLEYAIALESGNNAGKLKLSYSF
jgi:hypothetical protein